MLKVTVPASEFFDTANNEFIATSRTELTLEHSLVSVAKWESKWKKPFLSSSEKTSEEIIDYVKCMTLSKNVDPNVYYVLPPDALKKINDYIDDSMTATWFTEQPGGSRSREVITAEIIYYWMIALQIPFECQKWHLNRLLTLIRVCNIKQQPDKKMSRKQTMASNRALNAARRKAHGTKG